VLFQNDGNAPFEITRDGASGGVPARLPMVLLQCQT